MMSRESLFERIYDEVCDPWTLTEDEKEAERKCFYEALETGDIEDYVKSIEVTRDCICRPFDGVHGCYDFEEMRKFDDLISELKEAAVPLTTNEMTPAQIVTRTFDVGDEFFIDIEGEGNEYRAWIYHKGYGTKLLMFGVADMNLMDFTDAVKCDIADSKRWYRHDVMGLE